MISFFCRKSDFFSIFDKFDFVPSQTSSRIFLQAFSEILWRAAKLIKSFFPRLLSRASASFSSLYGTVLGRS